MRPQTRRSLLVGGLAGGGAVFLGASLRSRPTPLVRKFYPPEALVVAAVNVGQGEASWIKTPSGQFIVIGAGPDERAEPLVRSLRQAGATRIDVLVLPTPYRESVGGVPGLVESFPLLQAFDNGWKTVINSSHRAARAALAEKRVPLYAARVGQSFPLEGGVCEILHPSQPPVEEAPEAGNNSVVVRLRWGATTFLWAGGLERAGEEAVLERTDSLEAQWFRVARFGNGRATSPQWLRAVSPEFAVISVGPGEREFPDSQVLQRLEAAGTRVFRTDATPDAWVFLSDGSKITLAS